MKSRYFVITIGALAGTLLSITALAHQAGLMFNTTPSLPKGLWQISPITQQSIQRGRIVSICPMDTSIFQVARHRGYIPTGDCSGNYEPLLKPVAAIPGDSITINHTGIVVNGRALPNTQAKLYDSTGRPLHTFPLGRYQVKPGTVWLISTHNPNSFDSRYFGPLPAGNIRGMARPIWIGGKP